MKAKNILTLVAVGGGIMLISRLFGHRATNDSNKQSEKLTDIATAQAAKFYNLFGVIRQGGFSVATPVVLNSTKNKIAWLAANIYDWSATQKAFTKLCGGNYTLLDAAKTALINSTNYNSFVDYISRAQKQKRIFCGAIPYYSEVNLTKYGGSVFKNFAANQYVGRCQNTDDGYYLYYDSESGQLAGCDSNKFVLK